MQCCKEPLRRTCAHSTSHLALLRLTHRCLITSEITWLPFPCFCTFRHWTQFTGQDVRWPPCNWLPFNPSRRPNPQRISALCSGPPLYLISSLGAVCMCEEACVPTEHLTRREIQSVPGKLLNIDLPALGSEHYRGSSANLTGEW
jgi:hypothetical protein